jgi:hypothetical protein
MALSIPFRTTLPRNFLAAGYCLVPAGLLQAVALVVRFIPGRGCGRLRSRFPGLSRRHRWFGHRVLECRRGIRHRLLESRRGPPARKVRWARRIDSPAPLGGLSLRAPASPASKTPPIPRRFEASITRILALAPGSHPYRHRDGDNGLRSDSWESSSNANIAILSALLGNFAGQEFRWQGLERRYIACVTVAPTGRSVTPGPWHRCRQTSHR